jgi:hypothetical protein
MQKIFFGGFLEFGIVNPEERSEENWKKSGKYDEKEFVLNTKTGNSAKKMITTYAPERTEIVYCDVCYEREVLS